MTEQQAAEIEEPQSIHVLMGRVLREMPAIGKNQRNDQQKFNFRGIDDVLDALHPLLGRFGVFFVPDVIERRDEVRSAKSGGNIYVVQLHVRYTFYGPLGDSVTASAWGEGTDSGDKATPKAMTGALKYMLFQAFAVASAAVDDGDASDPGETQTLAQAARGKLMTHFKGEVDAAQTFLLDFFGDAWPGRLDQLTVGQQQRLILQLDELHALETGGTSAGTEDASIREAEGAQAVLSSSEVPPAEEEGHGPADQPIDPETGWPVERATPEQLATIRTLIEKFKLDEAGMLRAEHVKALEDLVPTKADVIIRRLQALEAPAKPAPKPREKAAAK
jgi:hypothetical protein